MNKSTSGLVMVLAAGVLVVVGTAATWSLPQESIQVPLPSDFEDITMITVPVSADSNREAVFVLNHRTGWLTGNFINEQTGRFSYSWSRNLTTDFFASTKTPPPESILRFVTGPASLPLYGRAEQSPGVIYVAEASTGQLVAYRFPRPVNPSSNLKLEKIDDFRFQ